MVGISECGLSKSVKVQISGCGLSWNMLLDIPDFVHPGICWRTYEAVDYPGICWWTYQTVDYPGI